MIQFLHKQTAKGWVANSELKTSPSAQATWREVDFAQVDEGTTSDADADKWTHE